MLVMGGTCAARRRAVADTAPVISKVGCTRFELAASLCNQALTLRNAGSRWMFDQSACDNLHENCSGFTSETGLVEGSRRMPSPRIH